MNSHKTRVERFGLEQAVLHTVLAAGTLGIALIAPNALAALYKTGVLPSARRTSSLYAARERLLRKKYLVKDSRGFVSITPLGKQYLKLAEVRSIGLPKKTRWDRTWRIVIFDIPESKKKARRYMTNSLRTAGFERVQDSVWAYPHDCEAFVALLRAELKIGKELLYLRVESFEGDWWLRKKFSLK